jgi:hypothetical protein
MIPKKLHYCWLGPDPVPEALVKCMNSWKRILPEYEIVCWDAKRFDVSSNKFVAQAFSVQKWAFASDYIRVFALFTEGGFYLDADVIVKKRFDNLLNCGFVTSVEYHQDVIERHDTLSLLNENGSSKIPNTRKPGIGLQAAILGARKEHPFLKRLLDWYQHRSFILNDGSYFNVTIAPDVYAMVAEKNYGFKYRDVQQNLRDDILILPSECFAGGLAQATEDSYAIHCGAGMWRDKSFISASLERFKRNLVVRKAFGRKPPLPH